MFIVLKEQLTVSVGDLASLHTQSLPAIVAPSFTGLKVRKIYKTFLIVLVEYFNAR